MDKKKLPLHVAIIMDGNGRWAKKKMQPRLFGHKAGIKATKKIVTYAGRLGIRFLTLYTFSTENWSRPTLEIDGLMNLLYSNLISEVKELNENKIRLNTIGDMSRLPEKVQKKLNEVIDFLSPNEQLTLTLALNYGSRDEIVRAVHKISADLMEQKIELNQINEETIKNYLDTQNLPDPDLVIRTSGEYRISNFLLYQSAYSEYYITQTLWPDFDEAEFDKAVESYQNRQRRFGGV